MARPTDGEGIVLEKYHRLMSTSDAATQSKLGTGEEALGRAERLKKD